VRGILAAMVVLATACGGDGGGGDGARRAQPTDQTAEEGPAADCVETSDVVAVDNEFEPICVIATRGDQLTVISEGSAQHTFTIRDTDVDVLLDPGDEENVEVPGELEAGAEHEFNCRFHPTMVGYLYVEA
jgi:plastocyanin